MPTSNWLQSNHHRLQAILLDISGVLFNSNASGGRAIDGSVTALTRYSFQLIVIPGIQYKTTNGRPKVLI